MNADTIARLKITLDGVKPAVLRRIEVPFAIRLDRLHLAIQAAIGWTNTHLYEIRAGDVGWGAPDPGWSDGPLDARKARLSDVVEDVSTKTLRYLYDFGDGWDHTIKIERLIPVIPILLEGTTIPSADQLPSDLQELSLRNGINVRHDSFHNDIDRLARGLKEQLRGGNWRDIFSSARDERTDRGESSVTEGRYSTCWCPRLKGRSTRRGS